MLRFSRLLIVLVFALPLAAQTKPLTPDTYLNALLKGNQVFVDGKVTYDNLIKERAALATKQYPPVTVLSCSDSRVPPELIFNQSLGSLFVIRVAGNVADELGIASIEYAIAQGYTKVILVLGHTSCGAVEASLAPEINCGTVKCGPTTPALDALKERIRGSFTGIPYDAATAGNVQRAIVANTRASAAQLLAASPVIRAAVLGCTVKLATAVYDLATGVVTPLDPQPAVTCPAM
ncbi:MAG: carbonic anhydrase [Acidobacteriota bacterium]|jgi:carbonic anhydrase|nr:carbonic anhydrase [Acidobacteriota bacterium]